MEELITLNGARALMPAYIQRANKLEENIKRANASIRESACENKNKAFLIVHTTQEAQDICAALKEKGFSSSYDYAPDHVSSDPLKDNYVVTIKW